MLSLPLTRKIRVASVFLGALLAILAVAQANHILRPSSSMAGRLNSVQYQKQQQQDKFAQEAAELSSTFKDWTNDYFASPNPESLSPRGLEVAKKRRASLKELILSDPAQALTLTVTADVRHRLPSAIQNELEKQVSAYGDYLVVASDEIDPASGAFNRAQIERTVVIKGKSYRASVYGRWLDMTSKKNIPINGIAIDDVLAVNESPVRVLVPRELLDLESRTLTEGEIAVEIGGALQYFKDDYDLSAFTQELISREMMIGPDTEEHKERVLLEAANGLSGRRLSSSFGLIFLTDRVNQSISLISH